MNLFDIKLTVSLFSVANLGISIVLPTNSQKLNICKILCMIANDQCNNAIDMAVIRDFAVKNNSTSNSIINVLLIFRA